MKRQTQRLLAGSDIDPATALAPIRWLVLGAFACALLACVTLGVAVMHVMSTTNELSMADERARAARIADLLQHVEDANVTAAIHALGAVAGLDDLALTPAASGEAGRQSIPLFDPRLGGQFLTWRAEQPGLVLLNTHAPVRVPLILGSIGGVVACLIAMLGHVRRTEAARLRAERKAERDHLTGLPNRLALERELMRRADDGEAFSMLALDLDRFKPINDLFGHHAGDLALIEVGRRLSEQLMPGEFLARVGGDEFVAIVQRGSEREALTQLARDCIAAIGRPLHVVGENVTVGISLGIVVAGLDHPANALLKQADRALYEAKRIDGAAFCFAGSGGRALPPEDRTQLGTAGTTRLAS